jgi:hypothetical protein
MNEKEKNRFDALSILWKGAWDNFHQRRNYEWKFCVSIWTAFSIFIASIISGKLVFKSIYILLWLIFYGGIITLFHFWFISGIQRAHKLDRNIAIHYEKIMQYISNSSFSKELEYDLKEARSLWGKLMGHWGPATQIGITILLYFGAVIIYCYLLTQVSLPRSM